MGDDHDLLASVLAERQGGAVDLAADVRRLDGIAQQEVDVAPPAQEEAIEGREHGVVPELLDRDDRADDPNHGVREGGDR